MPEGFGATMEEYRDWLVGELTALGGDVDLVGHDWGAGHVLGAVAARPDLVRTFATDCAGLVHPDYVWHDMAQAWQTPEVGEEVVAAMGQGTLADRTATYVDLGIDETAAADIVAAFDAVMADCILRLYRSAAQPAMAELGARLRATTLPPGLFVIATRGSLRRRHDHRARGRHRARGIDRRGRARALVDVRRRRTGGRRPGRSLGARHRLSQGNAMTDATGRSTLDGADTLVARKNL